MGIAKEIEGVRQELPLFDRFVDVIFCLKRCAWQRAADIAVDYGTSVELPKEQYADVSVDEGSFTPRSSNCFL